MKTKNRGAFSNPDGRFEKENREAFHDGWDIEEELPLLETTLIKEPAKSIITTNDSPDIGFDQSINPYRGCEHGCIYCYARPAHSYVNLSPGLDFETKIFYKEHAHLLLESELAKKKYVCKTIVIGANTDPYQPAEKELLVTRKLLEVLNRYHHPVALITKGSLIERDLDILSELASKNLVRVAVSVTSLSSKLKTILEPRTAAPFARLRVIRNLTQVGVPVRAMVAPIIPMINDMELETILQKIKEAGAKHASYVLVRLPHEVKDLFKEWLQEHYPDRAKHVMSIIMQMRGGKEYDSTFGKRMRGEGNYAQLLATRFMLACKKLQLNVSADPSLATTLFKRPNLSPQFELWD